MCEHKYHVRTQVSRTDTSITYGHKYHVRTQVSRTDTNITCGHKYHVRTQVSLTDTSITQGHKYDLRQNVCTNIYVHPITYERIRTRSRLLYIVKQITVKFSFNLKFTPSKHQIYMRTANWIFYLSFQSLNTTFSKNIKMHCYRFRERPKFKIYQFCKLKSS